MRLGSTASVSFQTAEIFDANLEVDAGAALGSGAITLDASVLTGTLDRLTNAVTLADTVTIDANGTISGAISGFGTLVLGVIQPLAPQTISLASLSGYSGLIDVEDAAVSLTGSVGGGPIVTVDNDTISAATGLPTVYQAQGSLVLNNGKGHTTVVGQVGPESDPNGDLPFPSFGGMTVNGGAGSLTVYGDDDGGTIIGGAAGGNVIVAGAMAAGYNPPTGPLGYWTNADGGIVLGPSAVTIEGGGNGDLLVVTGVLNNEIAAAGGNETLTGSTATGSNTFFTGSGSDEIVAGGGQDTVVGTGGSATVFGGTGGTAIFAGPGTMEVVGGTGADYVQVGQGASTLFAGAGAELIGVVNGLSGGSLTVVGFRPGVDQLDLQRYATSPTVTAAGGNTVLTFQDHTIVTLVGVPSNLI